MAETDTKNSALVKKDDALVGAAVSAGVGLAFYGLRKLLAAGGAGLSSRQRDEHDEDGRGESGRNGSLVGTAWQSASDSLLPLAEEAATAAGKWTARNSPELIRDRLLPRFIDAFKAAA